MQQTTLNRAVVSAVTLAILVTAPINRAAGESHHKPMASEWYGEAAELQNQDAVKANFDGNGYADLAVGAPGEDVGTIVDNAGSVGAFYWTSSTSLPSSGDFWLQGATGATLSEDDDQFGAVLAVGDFNGDGVYDLAVGVPSEDWGTVPDAGMVQVIYGVSGTGLTLTGHQWFDQGTGGIPGDVEDHDRFGFSLAAGDFDNDGFDDLAIGVPYEDIGAISNAGYVTVVFGSAGGLDMLRNQAWTRNDASETNENEWDDYFGWALAIGDFDGDGYDDLAIGTPADDLGAVTNSGAVDIIFGSGGGLTTRPTNDYWHQDRSGIAGTAEAYDSFGATLAAGDFNDDGYDDLAIGVPYEDVGAISNAGFVQVLGGSSVGLTDTGNVAFYQGEEGTSDSCELEDQFGRSLTVGDFNDDGYDDLVVGVPMEDLAAVPNAGMIHVFQGGSSGLDDQDQPITQDSLTVNGNSEGGDQFGQALAAADFNGDGYDDIAVGVPFEDIEPAEDAGWVVLLFGTPGPVSHDNAIVGQGSAGSGQTSEPHDRFGWSVAAIPFQSVSPNSVFSDGFESGNTSAWTSAVR